MLLMAGQEAGTEVALWRPIWEKPRHIVTGRTFKLFSVVFTSLKCFWKLHVKHGPGERWNGKSREKPILP